MPEVRPAKAAGEAGAAAEVLLAKGRGVMNDEASTDTMGLVSLICGVLAVVFSILQFMCIPFVGMLAPPLAIVSVVLGVIGMQQNANSTMSKAGTGVGCLAGIRRKRWNIRRINE